MSTKPSSAEKAREVRLPGIGELLKHLREEKDIGQADLAASVGCDRSTLCKIESGDASPSVELLERIARALGQRPEALVMYYVKLRYPKVAASEVGQLLQDFIAQL